VPLGICTRDTGDTGADICIRDTGNCTEDVGTEYGIEREDVGEYAETEDIGSDRPGTV